MYLDYCKYDSLRFILYTVKQTTAPTTHQKKLNIQPLFTKHLTLQVYSFYFAYLASFSILFGFVFPVGITAKTAIIDSMTKKTKTPIATHISLPPAKYTRGKVTRGRPRKPSIINGTTCQIKKSQKKINSNCCTWLLLYS